MATPATPHRDAKAANKDRRAANEFKYGTPLPLLLPESQLHPDFQAIGKAPRHSLLSSYLPSIASSSKLVNPQCSGTYDAATRSVWVTSEVDMRILFNRGFFGKGTLSRSDPSWLARRIKVLKGGDAMAAEEIRELRRKERKQFKIDRAQAMLDAAVAAEAVLTSSTTTTSSPGLGPNPSHAQLAPGTKLTPQTFLVRPERPSIRGPPSPAVAAAAAAAQKALEAAKAEDEGEFDESLVVEREHSQLALEEAWFLAWGIGVLRVLDPARGTYIQPGPELLSLFLTPPTQPSFAQMKQVAPFSTLYPDDPFLVSYVSYHHFRSLGYVVKPGVKFSADWLLYRRGPVFNHADFAAVVIPHFSSEEDRMTSPYANEDWYTERHTWQWISTVMRVNSLVRKTVILVYVTIPALSAFKKGVLPDGGLDSSVIDMEDLLKQYSVREVVMRRFVPARMRGD